MRAMLARGAGERVAGHAGDICKVPSIRELEIVDCGKSNPSAVLTMAGVAPL
jgi:hypothetical protein